MTYFTTYDLLIILRYRYVFFVKQKTAYAMRISDWSSDVCSSDLVDVGGHGAPPVFWCSRSSAFILAISRRRRTRARRRRSKFSSEIGLPSITSPAAIHAMRSEEHTSELQSLMRISYAVLCLKKKKNKK